MKVKVINLELSSGKIAIAILGGIISSLAEQKDESVQIVLERFIHEFLSCYLEKPISADKAIEVLQQEIEEIACEFLEQNRIAHSQEEVD